MARRKELKQSERNLPETSDGCPTGPCPYVSCRHHLYLDITKNGGLKINFPGIEPTDMMFPCAIRVANDKHDLTTAEVAAHLNATRKLAEINIDTAIKKIRTEYEPIVDVFLQQNGDVEYSIVELAKKRQQAA